MSFLSWPSRTRGHPLPPLHREVLLSLRRPYRGLVCPMYLGLPSRGSTRPYMVPTVAVPVIGQAPSTGAAA